MDIIPLPTRKERKGAHIIRASQKQSEILLNLFAQNPVASPESVKSISEETGLPTKWINSWFMRQRRKMRGVPTTTQGAMSTDAINEFKAEYQDPVLVDTTDEGITRKDKVPAKKKARAGRPKKIKTEHKDVENTSPNDMPLPPPSPKPLLLPTANTETAESDAGLSPSKFILREMVPRVWIPPESHRPPALVPSISSNSNLNLPTIHNLAPSQPGPHSSAYIAPQMQISDVRTALQPASYGNTPPTSRPPQSAHIFDITPIRVPNSMPDIPPYSLVPDSHGSLPGHWRHFQQQPRPYRASNLGPGRTADHRLLPSFNIPLSEPSVFTSRHASSYQPSRPAAYPMHMASGNWASGLEIPATRLEPGPGPEVAQVLAPPAQLLPPHQHYTSLLDPSATPLKYLTVLEPFERRVGTNGVYAVLHQDVVFDRLLDENLVQVDPFQAAMGLVFLSRLGLEWEY